jgi:hypothetical protein
LDSDGSNSSGEKGQLTSEPHLLFAANHEHWIPILLALAVVGGLVNPGH